MEEVFAEITGKTEKFETNDNPKDDSEAEDLDIGEEDSFSDCEEDEKISNLSEEDEEYKLGDPMIEEDEEDESEEDISTRYTCPSCGNLVYF